MYVFINGSPVCGGRIADGDRKGFFFAAFFTGIILMCRRRKQIKDRGIVCLFRSEALTGRLAGVQVLTTDGAPGAEIVIRVRGGGSVTQDNSPLYIVDGFPVNSINDIASFDF